MEEIYQVFNNSDIIVLASPMYYWSFTAQFKAVLDRLFAITEANNYQTPYKECIMMIAAGDDSEENFAPLVSLYNNLLSYSGWKDLGTVLAGGVMEIGDIKGHSVLDKAKALGLSI